MKKRSFFMSSRQRLPLLNGIALALCVAVSTMGFAPGLAWGQDAAELLKRTAERYRALDSYFIDGTVIVETTTGAGEQEFEMRFVMAEHPPAFVRAEAHGPTMQVISVSNEHGQWVYMPAESQYTFVPSTSSDDFIRVGRDLLKEYEEVDAGVERVRQIGAESIDIGGISRQALILEVAYDPVPTSAGADSTRKRLWIDVEEFLVLRDVTDAFVSETPFGEPVRIRETTAFTTLNVESPPDLSVFEFSPPEGAQQVDPTVLMGGGAVPQPGHPAPAFRLPRLDQGIEDLADLRGRVVLINFWATWCGPCLMEMPELERLHQAYSGQGLAILGVNIGEPASVVRDYVTRLGLTFPIALDESASVADMYQATSLPTSVVIDRDGRISRILLGAHPEEAFLQAVREAGL